MSDETDRKGARMNSRHIRNLRLLLSLTFVIAFLLVPTGAVFAGESCEHYYEYAPDLSYEPSCTFDGENVYRCIYCGDSYTEPLPAYGRRETEQNQTDQTQTETQPESQATTEPPAETAKLTLDHWYGIWAKDTETTHKATCRRCDHEESVDCTTLAVPGAGDIRICPVCGRNSAGDPLSFIENVQVLAKTGTLPSGDFTLRAGKLSEDFNLMTVCFADTGKARASQVPIQIVLPTRLLGGRTMYRLAADGTETPITVEANECSTAFDLSWSNSSDGAEAGTAIFIRLR